MYRHGWFQVAFERELVGELTPATIGSLRLVLVRANASVRAFNADCPHRGAHLAVGGKLDGNAISCPFHGHRIELGNVATAGCEGVSSVSQRESPVVPRFMTREFPCLSVGGLIFVRLSNEFECGLSELLFHLDRSNFFVPGFQMNVRVAASVVIENGFDSMHFPTVHHTCSVPQFAIRRGSSGELNAEAELEVLPTPWHQSPIGPARVSFTLRAFSPCIVISYLGGSFPYWVITSATPCPDGSCTVRLSLILPAGPDGPPTVDVCHRLLKQCRAGLETDQIVWENLSTTAPVTYTHQDAGVLEFQEFCREFESTDATSLE